VAAWIWIAGVPGSPKNDGWIEVAYYSFSRTKELDFSGPLDGSYSYLLQRLVRGDLIADAVLFVPSQREFHFYKLVVTSLTSSDETMNCALEYEKFDMKYDGSP